jgi:hypothetical protein
MGCVAGGVAGWAVAGGVVAGGVGVVRGVQVAPGGQGGGCVLGFGVV